MSEKTVETAIRTQPSTSVEPYAAMTGAGSADSPLSINPTSTADRNAFVNAMRGAVTGVNIVTTDGPGGRFGLTVSAFSSVSADPPVVLICINRRSPASVAVRENGQFCVNVLSTKQRAIADRFAGYPAEGAPYDFTAARWDEGYTGAPSLVDAIATFDCVLETTIDSGSHTVFIGRVLGVKEGEGRPLLYTDRLYGRPCTDTYVN
jgi:flavin reductase